MDKSRHALERFPFILVTGQARSGTTVVTRALAAHPQVQANGRESNYLGDLAQFIRANVEHPNRMRQCPVDADQFIAAFRTALYRVLFPAIDSVPSGIRAASAFSSIQVEWAEVAERLLPGLQWVLVIRNGIEVVESRRRHWNLAQHSFESHCRAWAAARRMFDWLEQRHNGFIVRHEQLLDRDGRERCMRDLQRHLGLEHSEACCEFVQNNRVSSRVVGAVDDGDLKSRSAPWTHWTDEERVAFERICGETCQRLRYPLPWCDVADSAD